MLYGIVTFGSGAPYAAERDRSHPLHPTLGSIWCLSAHGICEPQHLISPWICKCLHVSSVHFRPCPALQGGLDHRVSGAIITSSECTALLAAFVIVLSMLGVNVNALLLPAGVALAYAAKDLSHNFLAGEGPRHAVCALPPSPHQLMSLN